MGVGDPLISIRAGPVRRQAPLSIASEAGSPPVRFPCKPEECGSIKIELLSTLGSARALCHPCQAEYEVLLDAPPAAGADVQKGQQPFKPVPKLSFSVRRA